MGAEVEPSVDESEVQGSSSATFRLEDLLELVTDDNVHPEVSIGPPVGKEVW